MSLFCQSLTFWPYFVWFWMCSLEPQVRELLWHDLGLSLLGHGLCTWGFIDKNVLFSNGACQFAFPSTGKILFAALVTPLNFARFLFSPSWCEWFPLSGMSFPMCSQLWLLLFLSYRSLLNATFSEYFFDYILLSWGWDPVEQGSCLFIHCCVPQAQLSAWPMGVAQGIAGEMTK